MKLLLAADNPGGANVLASLFAPARMRGHGLALRPSGAATALWQAQGEVAAASPMIMDAHVVVTGTGFSDTERLIWREAAECGIPSIAVIDAWTNLPLRFRMAGDGTPSWPDVVAVPDQWVKDEVTRLAPAQVTVEVVGQPHLEATTARLTLARAARQANAQPVTLWVSEPVAEDFPGGTRGFDQYQVFEELVRFTTGRLIVCPHPREDRQHWQAMGGFVELATAETTALLVQADSVIGMTSMVLVEAALAGIPALSLQPGRTGAANPLVDRLCPTITHWPAMGPEIRRFLSNPAQAAPPPGMMSVLEGATSRLLGLIERHARAPACATP